MAAEAKQQGNDYYRSGEYEKAVAAYTQAINLASGGGDTALYLNNRAAAHLALRNLRAALADAKSAVAKDSTFAKAHARVGSVLRELGKCQEAEASYREACRLDPSNNSFKAALEDCRRSRAGLASFVQTNVQDSIMFAVRVFLLSQALFYMLPFVGKGVAGSAYSRAMLGSAGLNGYVLYKAVGPPTSFDARYLAQLLQNESSHSVVLALIFFGSRPLVLALIPVFFGEIVQVAFFAARLLQIAGWKSLSSRLSGPLDAAISRTFDAPTFSRMTLLQRWGLLSQEVTKTNAFAVIGIGIFMIFEMFTPMRSATATMMIWSLLRMKYATRHFATVQAFSRADAMLDSLAGKGGPTVQNGYRWFSTKLASFARPPQPVPEAGNGSGEGSMFSRLASGCNIQ